MQFQSQRCHFGKKKKKRHKLSCEILRFIKFNFGSQSGNSNFCPRSGLLFNVLFHNHHSLKPTATWVTAAVAVRNRCELQSVIKTVQLSEIVTV